MPVGPPCVNAPLPLHLDLISVGQFALELAVTRMVVVMTSYCFRTSSTTLEESLKMDRELHGDKAHPGVAASLHDLGIVSRDGGDLAAARRYVWA